MFNWFVHFSFLFLDLFSSLSTIAICDEFKISWRRRKKKADKGRLSRSYIKPTLQKTTVINMQASKSERSTRRGSFREKLEGVAVEVWENALLEFPLVGRREKTELALCLRKTWRQRNYNKESVNFSCRQINFHSKMIMKKCPRPGYGRIFQPFFPLIPLIPSRMIL